MPPLYSKYNPTFRRNLLNFAKSHTLKDMVFYGLRRIDVHDKSIDLSEYSPQLCALHFSNDFILEISGRPTSLVQCREQLKNKKIVNFSNSDKSFGRPPAFGLSADRVTRISIVDLQSQTYLPFIGAKLLDVYLLFGIPRSKISGFRLSRSEFGVRGISLDFGFNKLLIYLNFDNAFKFLEVEASDNLLQQEVFRETKDFIEPGKKYNFLHLRDYIIPNETLNDNWFIFRKDILSEFLDPINYGIFKVDPEEIEKILQQFPEIDLTTQIQFFEDLKEELISKKIGLLDLKFGLDKELNFKIILPVDYASETIENIVFLDSIIKYLSSVTPKAIG